MGIMNFRLLGRSGLRVSEMCIGCGTFGTNWGPMGSDLNESRRILETFAEAGGNYIDTSNRYQEGQSEQYLGEIVRGNRDRWVLASKFTLFDGGADNNNPNLCGNHRKNLMRSVEGSLKRLGTDHIDLLWAHIWDFTTPIDEMLRGLDDVVRSGKVLYVGASNFPAWWIARANTMADFWGKTPFVATQVEWSLVERSLEPEFLPMCAELDIALVCWSALAGGMVTGKYNRGKLPPGPNRLAGEIDPEKKEYWHEITKRNLAIMDKVVKIADRIGRPTVQVALRWLMQQPKVVSIPILSTRTAAQMKECVGCLDFTLTGDQMAAIDQATEPAISSIMPNIGPYPYPMLEYGSPALPGFYSRALTYGNVEKRIQNHRRPFPYKFNR